MFDPLEQAQELMLWGNFDAAQSLFLDLLAKDTESDVLLYHLGLCNLSFEYFQEAIRYFTECLRVNSKHVDALIDLGDTWLSLEKNTEAKLCFDRAYALEPNNARVLVSLAHFYDYEENFNRAVELYEQAMVLADPAEAPRYELALAYGRIGRYLEADLMLDSLITESLRRGTQSFIGDWNAASREDLAGAIGEMREERQYIAQDHLGIKGYDIMYSRYMYYCIKRIQALETQQTVSLYRELQALWSIGVDTSLTRSHYRLTTIEGTYTGIQLACLFYAVSKNLNLDIPGNPIHVRAYEDARELFS